MGYSNYYLTLLTNLGGLDEMDNENHHISSGISKIDRAKASNKKMKQTNKFKRRCKHGQLAKTRQQVFKERVDRAAKMGTYATGVAILGQIAEQANQSQQSSNGASAAPKQTSNTPRN